MSYAFPQEEIVIPSYVIKATDAEGHPKEVGAIQSINPSEDREITESYQIGTDLIKTGGEPFELVPGLIRNRRLAVNRVALWGSEIIQAFGNGDITGLGSQNKYFDITEFRQGPSDDSPKPIRTYKDCLIQRWDATRDLGRPDIRELQTATITFRRIEIAKTSS